MPATPFLRRIGNDILHPVGLGCMNFCHGYGHYPSEAEVLSMLAECVDMGVQHFDTAAMYGAGLSETLVGKGLKAHRNKVFLASKCGMTMENGKRVIDGRPSRIKEVCDEALQRLQTDHIDLYYIHRWDRTVPIEDTIGAMKELVAQGKIRYVGLSEVSAPTLMKAHAVHPIAALQTEYSLWTREPEIAVLEACEKINAAFVAFSPVARGLLTAQAPIMNTLEAKDLRQTMPRFTGPSYIANLKLQAEFVAIAKQANCSPAQLALAWLLQQGEHIHVIPGTRSAMHMRDNFWSTSVSVSPSHRQALNALINEKTVKGGRYTVAAQGDVDTEVFSA